MNKIWNYIIKPKLLFILRFPKFVYQWIEYRHRSTENIPISSLHPCLSGETHPYDRHYMHQDSWLIEKLTALPPSKRHVSVGGRVDGFLWQYIALGNDVLYLDINRPPLSHERLIYKYFDLAEQIPTDITSYGSVSCMHVLEHIGLGRYGDNLDPDGWRRGLNTLASITSWWGSLYLSVPIGNPRVCFNAHRIFDPVVFRLELRKNGLMFIDTAVVDDNGVLHYHDNPEYYRHSRYALGLYHMKKVPDENLQKIYSPLIQKTIYDAI